MKPPLVFLQRGVLKSAAKGKFQTASKTPPHTALPTDILMPAISASNGVGVSLWLKMKRNKLSRDVKLNSG